MRPQVGKRAALYKPPPEIKKTKFRLFVESRIRQNLSVGRDFILYHDVTKAININALEQRMITKQKVVKLIEKGCSKEKLITML